MIKKFSDNPVNASRALQIWQILISKAHNRQTITYKMLADLLHFKGQGVFGEKLGHIMYFCIKYDLPHLTALVVNEKYGIPGQGFIEVGSDINKVQEEVFNYDWYDLYPPSETDFDKAWHMRDSLK